LTKNSQFIAYCTKYEFQKGTQLQEYRGYYYS